MKKMIVTTVLAGVMAISMSISAFAGTWLSDATGWWWQNSDGSYPSNCWMWIDGNNDGISECYYFNENGYCLMNTVTPDGYEVNSTGAWVKDGAIQQQAASHDITTPSGSSVSSGVIFTESQAPKKSSDSSSSGSSKSSSSSSSSSSSKSSSSSSSKTVNLTDLTPSSSSHFGTSTNVRVYDHELWSKAIYLSTSIQKSAYVEYKTDGKYNTLSFTYSLGDEGDDDEFVLEVYGDDDELLWQSARMSNEDEGGSATVDISGQKYVKIFLDHVKGSIWNIAPTMYLKNAQFKK